MRSLKISTWVVSAGRIYRHTLLYTLHVLDSTVCRAFLPPIFKPAEGPLRCLCLLSALGATFSTRTNSCNPSSLALISMPLTSYYRWSRLAGRILGNNTEQNTDAHCLFPIILLPERGCPSTASLGSAYRPVKPWALGVLWYSS